MKKTPLTTEQTIPSREDLIRERAFELYEKHGRQEGSELDDWLQAEKEILEMEVKEQVAVAA